MSEALLKIAYLDMVGGVSGDMLLGALVDAGLDLDDLRAELRKLAATGFELSASKTRRAGVDATLVTVELDDEGSRKRDWTDFENSITGSTLSESVKSQSLQVFELLARAESTAHGVSKEDTHLHELGTVDTLVDVVGAIAGLDALDVERVYASPFPLSMGTSSSSHGVMAATAAATGAIYRMTGASTRAGGGHGPRGEAVTPTGAAIVATIGSFEPVSFTTRAAGYGAGNRNPDDYPNVVSLWLGESEAAPAAEAIRMPVESDLALLETNIDDMTGEALGYVQERLMQAGALDAWLTPVQMKKGRPGTLLSVLCRPALEGELLNLVMRESTTLGVRRRSVDRYVADRETIHVSLEYGEVDVKIKRLNGEVAGVHPEFEQCREIAIRLDIPLSDVTAAATEAALKQLGEQPGM